MGHVIVVPTFREWFTLINSGFRLFPSNDSTGSKTAKPHICALFHFASAYGTPGPSPVTPPSIPTKRWHWRSSLRSLLSTKRVVSSQSTPDLETAYTRLLQSESTLNPPAAHALVSNEARRSQLNLNSELSGTSTVAPVKAGRPLDLPVKRLHRSVFISLRKVVYLPHS